jgi:lysophospholipase L1-like esterase
MPSAPAAGGPAALRRLHGGIAAAVLGLLLAGAAGAQTVYVAFGDSITEGIGDDPTRSEQGYPPRLEALLQAAGNSAVVHNRGIEGETTAEGISRINSVLTATPADVLLLMEGTNDIPLISNETINFNLEEIGRRAALRGTTTVHATLFPRRRDAARDGDNNVTGQLSGLIRELAWRTNRKLADPFEVFFNTPGLDTLYYPPGDRFHPNAAGYDRMAELFFDILTDVDRVPPVVGRVRPPDKSEGVAPAARVSVDVYDFGAGINEARTFLEINGERVAATVRGDSRRLELSFQPPAPLRGVVSLGLVSEDTASPVNAVDRRVSRFIVAGTTFLNGDVDRDGRVDGTDLVRLALAFGASRGDSRFVSTADLNSDDVIDGEDLAILASNFGRSSF